ncbi:potassium-transporting ATPase subunit C [Arcanobacterium bovis]|uniref:Potassium-transporting ATPase KdpC subunit n=1 Tax=Arcanobacterium bovis TaxID=2529275 RepID=A0A4Q9UZ05_9ACTO|nr:potassium-transporting ATPase subunit C [Arcanobacterium bovis]TBW20857.1 potassium-transporting ATPase subunit C [Arcanobacterium bovis]
MSLSRMKRVVLTATKMFIVFTLLLGLVYPLVFVGVGQIFARQSRGSYLMSNGGDSETAEVIGSELLAQPVTKPGYFFYRASSAGDGWDPMQSGASNLSPASTELQELAAQRRRDIAQREHVNADAIPADAVTASGSGLDPHISLAYARIQAARVARERGMTQAQIDRIINEQVEHVFNGFKDGQIVNVTALNHALDLAQRHAEE